MRATGSSPPRSRAAWKSCAASRRSSRCSATRNLGAHRAAQADGLRLTYTLTKLGYLRHNMRLGKYQLGSAVLSIGYPLLASMNVRQVARR